jgi:hypothetical protein
MEPDDLVDLPLAYAAALRFHAAGVPDDVVALGLGVEPESVPTLRALGRRRLDHLRSAGSSPRTPERPGDEH